ncbi:hypothetical protein [Natrinema sp. 74]
MHVDLRQKVVASIVGVAFVVGALALFPWWVALLVAFVLAPFYVKILPA